MSPTDWTRWSDLRLRSASQLESKPEILAHRHMRVERVVLEDHGDVAFARLEIGDVTIADEDRALGHILETGDHPQQSRFAAPRRADEDDEFPLLDIEFDRLDRPHPVWVYLSDRFQLNPGQDARGMDTRSLKRQSERRPVVTVTASLLTRGADCLDIWYLYSGPGGESRTPPKQSRGTATLNRAHV